jgi:tetrapyrrole methylase family protein / MazG family protein
MTEPRHPSPPANMTSDTLMEIMARLRSPDGCPWDREQTPQSLKPYLLEETYEVLEALDSQDPTAVKEELGDLLLQILFHAQIASEDDQFTFHDVCRTLGEKLIRRHPHVFASDPAKRPVSTPQEVVTQWDQLKQAEQGPGKGPVSALRGVPKTSPALDRAYQVQKRAARSGFDWHTIEPVLDKFREELHELSEAAEDLTRGAAVPPSPGSPQADAIEHELGDVLFSLVNLARFLQVNPEEALRKSTNRFIRRFTHVEQQAARNGKSLHHCSPREMDDWWESAKHLERQPELKGSESCQKGEST